MTNSPVILVLGATGKAGSLVARILEDNGITVRRASRSSKDVRSPGTTPNLLMPLRILPLLYFWKV